MKPSLDPTSLTKSFLLSSKKNRTWPILTPNSTWSIASFEPADTVDSSWNKFFLQDLMMLNPCFANPTGCCASCFSLDCSFFTQSLHIEYLKSQSLVFSIFLFMFFLQAVIKFNSMVSGELNSWWLSHSILSPRCPTELQIYICLFDVFISMSN